jgi:hypothetical protein
MNLKGSNVYREVNDGRCSTLNGSYEFMKDFAINIWPILGRFDVIETIVLTIYFVNIFFKNIFHFLSKVTLSLKRHNSLTQIVTKCHKLLMGEIECYLKWFTCNKFLFHRISMQICSCQKQVSYTYLYSFLFFILMPIHNTPIFHLVSRVCIYLIDLR